MSIPKQEPLLHLVYGHFEQGRKKLWSLAKVTYDEETGEPNSCEAYYPSPIRNDKEGWYELYDELGHALFHRTKYKLVRGKLKELK